MFMRVAYPAVAYDRYLALMPPNSMDQLRAVAEGLKDLRIVHINSTATGGGVAEILQSLVPLTNGLGVPTERVVINPPAQFFEVTKRIHNLLQGAEGCLSPEDLDIYFQSIQNVADDMKRQHLTADVWFLHDPQLLPLAKVLPRGPGETRIWVCHIDLTAPNRGVLDVLLPLTRHYDHLVFSLPSYVPKGLGGTPPVCIAPPAIDPLAVKNIPVERQRALEIVSAMGIDPARPLVSQVSRFDYWKDPWGVVNAYRLARRSVPGLQLALLGLSQAVDDPEALTVLESVMELAAGDPDIHLFYHPIGLPGAIDEVVNGFQVASDVVVQKSTREGFGLTVTEAMWKGKPVIGGNVGGIRTQIEDGVNGYLVDTSEECAKRIVEVFQAPELHSRMGQAAREAVRQRYMMPALALDYLNLARAHALGADASGDASGVLASTNRA